MDCLARLRVAARPGGALRYLERAELEERHGIARFQCLADGVECRRDNGIGVFLRRAGLSGDGFDEVCFFQKNPLFHCTARFYALHGYYSTEILGVNRVSWIFAAEIQILQRYEKN